MNGNKPDSNLDNRKVGSDVFLKIIWDERKIFFISFFLSMLLGVFASIITPSSYTVSVVLVPLESSKSTSSQLDALSALTGVKIKKDITSSELLVNVYPKIVRSVPFRLELMNKPINFPDVKTPISLLDYYSDPKYRKTSVSNTILNYTIGLPNVLRNIIHGTFRKQAVSKTKSNKVAPKRDYILLTNKQYSVARMLSKRVGLLVENKQNFMTLKVSMTDPVVAAQVAQYAQQILQQKITEFRIQKVQADLDFIEKRFNEIKPRAERLQRDFVLQMANSSAQPTTDLKQTKYEVINDVYLDLAKQLEQAKIQVKKETPMFTVLEPATVPTQSSWPNRPLLILFFMFLGTVIGVGIIVKKRFYVSVFVRI